MGITIQKYKQSDLVAWESFLEHSNNGTLFHSHKFLSYHPADRFLDNSLIFQKKENIVSVLPAAIKKQKGKKVLISHPGASVGSCIVPADLAFSEALEIVEKLSEYAKSEQFDVINITLPPVIYSRRLSQYMDFAYKKNGFVYTRREVTSVLFLEKTIDKNLSKFKSTHRTAVRKAEKSGIIVKQSDNFEEFYSILNNNLSIRHNVSPTHTLTELLHLKQIFPEKIHLFGAYLDNKMIAGVVNFILNKKVVMAFYISHKDEYQKLRPINLLFYKICDWAIKGQFNIFDFGIFTVHEKPNMGLARFKENFGASGVFRDTMELILS